jgi:PAS domain S-box-containing protein
LTVVWFLTEKGELEEHIASLTQDELNQQQNYLRLKVQNTLDYIDFKIKYSGYIPEEELKNEILEWIAQNRLIYDGYIFVNTIEGQALIFDGKKVDGYKNISDMTDPNGLRLFDMEKKGYYTEEGKFMEYLFKPMDSDSPEEKISFVRGFRKWGWIVGAGIYKRIPTQLIQNERLNHIKSFYRKLWAILVISLALMTIGYFIVRWIGNLLNNQVSLLQSWLRNVNTKDEYVELDRFRYEELRQIGSSVNQMLDEKIRLKTDLEKADQNLKLVFQVAEDVAFIVAEPSGKKIIIKEFSPGAEKIFGYTKDEIENQNASLLFTPESLHETIKIIRELNAGSGGISGETQCVKKSGNQFNIFFNIHHFKKYDGTPGFMAVVIDITESKRTAEELRKLKTNLELKVEERTKEIIAKSDQLAEKNKELEYYNKLFIGREFRINELKQKIKELESKLKEKS